jgi:hypothetical protein
MTEQEIYLSSLKYYFGKTVNDPDLQEVKRDKVFFRAAYEHAKFMAQAYTVRTIRHKQIMELKENGNRY